MLSTRPEHINGGERGWSKVDSSLAVYTATSTNQKMRGLRQLFSQLDLDANDLVFTLRSDRTDEALTEAVEAGETGVAPSPYAAITKFRPRFEELSGSASDMADTADIREEFRLSFQEFTLSDPMTPLDGRPFHAFAPEIISDSSSEQVLALIQLTLQQESMFNPRALHDAIVDGHASAWLVRLERG